MNIYQTKFVAENGIEIPFNRNTAVCITRHNGYRLMEDSMFCEVLKILMFPERKHAEYFVNHQNETKGSFRDCMLKDDYQVFLIELEHRDGPDSFEEETYIDDFYMEKDYVTVDWSTYDPYKHH